MNETLIREKDFYLSELYERILPFWEVYAPDSEYGGFFTCFSGNGGQLLSEDKYIWSQGRILWVLSRLLGRGELTGKRREALRGGAQKTARFLMEHALLPSGNCVFLTERDGTHKAIDGVYDTSLYADCFVIIGLAEYALAADSRPALDFAKTLYQTARRRYEAGNFRTDPYPVPHGYRTHGLPMIFTNTSRTLADAMKAFGDPEASEVSRAAYAFARDVFDHFVDENGILHEMIPQEGGFDEKTLLGRYINPGHTIEDCWFMHTEWALAGGAAHMKKTAALLSKTLSLGWDGEYGGIRLFADMDGSTPHGEIPDASEPMVKKVTGDNMSKLWWPHSEALYSTMLFSDDEGMLTWYRKVKDYTFSTFPNRENDRGEWIQIRDRAGHPENRIVALPVKDPFHIMRNLILILELCEKSSGQIDPKDREELL